MSAHNAHQGCNYAASEVSAFFEKNSQLSFRLTLTNVLRKCNNLHNSVFLYYNLRVDVSEKQ